MAQLRIRDFHPDDIDDILHLWEEMRSTQAEPVYGFKVLVDEASDHILGAHLVGPHVEEVINIFALAIRHGLTADDLRTTMFAYPTGASDISSML